MFDMENELMSKMAEMVSTGGSSIIRAVSMT
jgi:hypothetical protein